MRRDKIHSSVKLATTQPTQFYLADFMHVKLSVREMTHFFISVLSSPILKKKIRLSTICPSMHRKHNSR